MELLIGKVEVRATQSFTGLPSSSANLINPQMRCPTAALT